MGSLLGESLMISLLGKRRGIAILGTAPILGSKDGVNSLLERNGGWGDHQGLTNRDETRYDCLGKDWQV